MRILPANLPAVPAHADVAPCEALVRNVISVSCCSETVAVALVGSERELAATPELAALLSRILADEVGHARFGWRLLNELAPRWDAPLRARLSAYLVPAFRHQLAFHAPFLALPTSTDRAIAVGAPDDVDPDAAPTLAQGNAALGASAASGTSPPAGSHPPGGGRGVASTSEREALPRAGGDLPIGQNRGHFRQIRSSRSPEARRITAGTLSATSARRRRSIGLPPRKGNCSRYAPPSGDVQSQHRAAVFRVM